MDGQVVRAEPRLASADLVNAQALKGKLAMVWRDPPEQTKGERGLVGHFPPNRELQIATAPQATWLEKKTFGQSGFRCLWPRPHSLAHTIHSEGAVCVECWREGLHHRQHRRQGR